MNNFDGVLNKDGFVDFLDEGHQISIIEVDALE
jgi:hypothetical protein